MKNSKKTKISLAESLNLISQLEEAVDNQDQEGLEAIYDQDGFIDSSNPDFRAAVDRRIMVNEMFRSTIDHAKNKKQQWDDRVSVLNRAYDSFKANTIYHIISNPRVRFEGDHGKLVMQKNGGKPRVELNFETDKTADIVSDEDIFKYGIPEDCFATKTVNILLKDKLYDHIMKNSDIEVEHLNTDTKTVLANTVAGKICQGKHLRVKL